MQYILQVYHPWPINSSSVSLCDYMYLYLICQRKHFNGYWTDEWTEDDNISAGTVSGKVSISCSLVETQQHIHTSCRLWNGGMEKGKKIRLSGGQNSDGNSRCVNE